MLLKGHLMLSATYNIKKVKKFKGLQIKESIYNGTIHFPFMAT